jgi:SAM-dependent methyltransferase
MPPLSTNPSPEVAGELRHEPDGEHSGAAFPEHRQVVEFFWRVAPDLGHRLDAQATVLDLGCGDGKLVAEFRALGYRAFGADLPVDDLGCFAPDYCRPIAPGPYRLPFEDDSFDFVFSNQVLEHVKNYDETLREVRRVLKPGGLSVHLFPARLRLIECHVFVPLAGAFQGQSYLRFWAWLGIRAPHQRGMSAAEAARSNVDYLGRHTNYLTKRAIRRHVRSCFGRERFIERLYLKHWYLMGKKRFMFPIVRWVPFVGPLFSALHNRVLAFERPKD